MMTKPCLYSLSLIALAGALALPASSQSASSPVHPSSRVRERLDSGWRFEIDRSPAAATAGPGRAISAWRLKFAPELQSGNITALPADLDSGAWQPAGVGGDVFGGRPGFAWFQSDLGPLTDLKPGGVPTIHFEGVDDNATVFLNGKFLRRHQGYDEPFDVVLGDALKPGGPNILTVLVENQAGGGGLLGAVTLDSRVASAAAAVIPTPQAALPAYNDKAWRMVHLPHDYVVEGTFDPHGDAGHGSLPTPPAWYRKTFTLPIADKGKAVWIDFDGVYRDSKIYLNGQMLGEHPSGYTGFRYDISRAAHYGTPNVLAVHVDPRKVEGWWYEGGGIYRHVWLNVAALVHVAPWGTFVTATLPEPKPGAAAAPAAVTIATTLSKPDFITVNGLVPQYRLVSRVFAPDGKAVGAAVSPVAYVPGQASFSQQVTVAHPQLWSLETPRLYRLHTEIQDRGRVVDTQDTPFGIRTLRFDANSGFYLNGKRVELQGTCNHQDFAGVGIGLPDSLQFWRIQRLKEMGCNAYRTSHNPPTPELLDACDKLGMLVMDENRHLGDTYKAKTPRGTTATNFTDLDALLLRDRNHPSVIMWSLCNEEFSLQDTPEGARLFAAMAEETRRLDKTRPVTAAVNSSSSQGISQVEDLRGFNYNSGSYDRYHQAHPTQPLYGSETSSEVGTRGIYANDPVRGYVSAYDDQPVPWGATAEGAWQAIATQPYFAGGFVWTGFDYKGEPTPYGWPCVNSHFGILDEAGFPKDNFYYYQSVWGTKPMVHLLPHWNWKGREGQAVPVWAYSNAARVELLLNGTSLGTKPMVPFGHLEWSVPYTPGTLEARGYDSSGKLVSTDKVETTGAPASLRLSTDRKTLASDGEDATIVTVAVLDAQGRVIPTASNMVQFVVSGAGHLDGVGNGDPSSHEPDQGTQRSAFNGLCLAIVQAGDTPGIVHFSATSPGLAPARMDVQVGPSHTSSRLTKRF